MHTQSVAYVTDMADIAHTSGEGDEMRRSI
jgi:hypothetical protein